MNRYPFLLGLAIGILYWTINVSWIFSAINFYGAGILFSILISSFLIIYLSLYIGIFTYICSRFWDEKYFVLIAPSSFFLLEALRSYLLTGVPWLRLGMLADELWGMLPLVGVAGTSFLIVLGVALLAKSKQSRFHVPLSGLIFLSLVFGPGHFQQQPESRAVKVAVIQPVDNNLTKLQNITSSLDDDIVVWPEGVARLDTIPLNNSKQVIVGGFYTVENNKIFNSIVNLNNGEKNNKRNLVPFGEFQPFNGALNNLSSFFVSPYFKDLTPGSNNQEKLTVLGEAVSGLICWELVFDQTFIKRTLNTGLIFHVSNDSWYGDSMPPQHFRHVKARAVESNKWVIRSTKDGISAIISPSLSHNDQKILRGKEGYISETISFNNENTIFLIFGNWPLFILSCLVMTFAMMNSRKPK